MAAHYGYIKRTLGNDGDHIDVFLGPYLDSQIVVVVDQTDQSGRFDEHKALLGFRNSTDAIACYRKCYTKGWKVGRVTTLTIEQFKQWLKHGKKTKPIYNQVSRYSVSELVVGKHGDRGRFVTTDDGNRIFLTEAGTINRTGKPIDAGQHGTREIEPKDQVRAGQRIQVPPSHSFGEFEAELTDEGGGVLGLRMAGSERGPLVKLLAGRMQQLMDDLSGRVPLKTQSGNPSIDAVGQGKARFLGRGNDGLAFDTGDGNVVKVSSLFAYHWTAPHRSEEGAINHTKRGYEIGKKLREAGVQGIVPQEYAEHEGRAFLTMPKLDTQAKITPEHVKQVQQTIKGMLDAGYSLFDEIQVGIGQDGNAYIFDLGQAGPLRGKEDRDDADSALRRFAKEHGVEIGNADPQAAMDDALTKARKHIEGWESRGVAPGGLKKMIAEEMEKKFRLAVEDDPSQHDWWIDELTELMNRLNAVPNWQPKERNSAMFAEQYSSPGGSEINASLQRLTSEVSRMARRHHAQSGSTVRERFSAMFDAAIERYAGIHSDKYAARGPKNSPGQMSLFGGDQPLRSSKVQQKFRWITVHPPGHEKGQPVLIDDNGTIKGGMGGKLTGKNLSEIGKKQPGKATGKTSSKRGGKVEPGSGSPQSEGKEYHSKEPLGRKRDDSPEAKVLGKRAGDAKVLGATLFEALEDHRAVTIVGQTVNSRDDLASLAQVYRDPRYETLRAFFVDANGRVVGHNAYSMRHPAMVAFPEEAVDSLERDMVASGAVGFYMLHNHPSGNPEPSMADLRMQRYLGERFGKRSLGHVVINHNRYAVIDNNGVPEVKDLPKPNENLTDPSKVKVPHDYLGEAINSTAALAGLAAKVRPEKDRAVMVFCNVKGKVTMLLDISADSMRLPDYKVLGAIRRAARATGSERRFLVMPEGADPKEARVWIRRGIVMDAVESGKWSTEREKGASAGADPIEERAVSNPRTKKAILRERMT